LSRPCANFWLRHLPNKITLYENAENYLKQVLNGRNKIPLSSWNAEQAKLIAYKQSLTRDYNVLKSEVAEAEKIRYGVCDIMRGEARSKQRSRDLER